MEGKFNYDYARTMWMKMYLATPDFPHGTSDVKINFEQALGIMKTVDALTQGITKILYLVGWQGLGHDDCYPEMHKVNDFLKRDCDRDGRESLLWLIAEAKKYHTVVSETTPDADTKKPRRAVLYRHGMASVKRIKCFQQRPRNSLGEHPT